MMVAANASDRAAKIPASFLKDNAESKRGRRPASASVPRLTNIVLQFLQDDGTLTACILGQAQAANTNPFIRDTRHK